jgi:hypothetical protein
MSKFARGTSTSLRGELKEVEVVVKHLPRIVKQRSLGVGYDLREVMMSLWSANNRLVEIINVSEQMFSVMEFYGFTRNVGFKGICGIRKFKVFESTTFFGNAAAREGEQKGEYES